MTQSNNIFYETGEIDYDSLSPYERFQLEKYGYIIPSWVNPFETETASNYPREEAHIYETLNPE